MRNPRVKYDFCPGAAFQLGIVGVVIVIGLPVVSRSCGAGRADRAELGTVQVSFVSTRDFEGYVNGKSKSIKESKYSVRILQVFRASYT